MPRIVVLLLVISSVYGQSPLIDWGQCPELEPTETDKVDKVTILENCVKQIPFPRISQNTNENDTRQIIDDHRERIAFCALDAEKWFKEDGSYNFEKALREISKKKLIPDIASKIGKQHSECQSEATEKFPNAIGTVVKCVQLYQACMDFHLSQLCKIRIVQPQQPPQPPQ